jgi:Xaa-Pro aminopeptidase
MIKTNTTPFANVERLRRSMQDSGLAAVIARSGVNFTYLSGVAYAGTLARHLDLAESPRPVFVVWPLEGEPVVIVNALAEAITRRDSWIRNVVTYSAYTGDPLDKLCDVLRELGVADSQVGFEEHYLSAAQCGRLQHALPHLRLVECGQLFAQVRQIKTPGEVALLKQAADLLDDAFLEVYSSIAPGETERSVHARMVASCMQRGATFAHGWMASSRNTVPAGGQSDVAFLPGDVVRTDYVAYVRGYPGHASRNAVLGTPSPQQLDAYRKVREVYLAAVERCRPGAIVGEIYKFVAERFAASGLRFKAQLVGHGVDCWWHQQEPIFAPGNKAQLERDMVIALEPASDEWVTQDLYHVTQDGVRLLSDKFKTDELHVIRLSR